MLNTISRLRILCLLTRIFSSSVFLLEIGNQASLISRNKSMSLIRLSISPYALYMCPGNQEIFSGRVKAASCTISANCLYLFIPVNNIIDIPMYKSIRFPRQLSAIKDSAAFRSYCLNPLGLQQSLPNHFEKKGQEITYLNEQV